MSRDAVPLVCIFPPDDPYRWLHADEFIGAAIPVGSQTAAKPAATE